MSAVAPAPAPLRRWRASQWWYFVGLPLAVIGPLDATDREAALEALASADITAAARLGWRTLAAANPLSALEAGLALLSAAALLASGYLANAIGDHGMDRSATKNPLLGDAVPRSAAREVQILGLIALLAALVAGGVVGAAAASVAFAGGYAYSLGPRLKRLPIVGSMMNVVYFGPMLALAWQPGATARLATLAGLFAGLLLGNQWIHEAADADEDRGGGVATTFLRVGRGTTAALATLVALSTAAAALAAALPTATCVAVALAASIAPVALLTRGARPAAMGRARRLQRLLGGAALLVAWATL
jgi:1,4-dihydroxy-2-naphthoate octaprenyltransferase